jgi:hypothetical protein
MPRCEFMGEKCMKPFDWRWRWFYFFPPRRSDEAEHLHDVPSISAPGANRRNEAG